MRTLALALLLAGCTGPGTDTDTDTDGTDTDTDNDTGEDTGTSGPTKARVAHMMAGALPIDVTLDSGTRTIARRLGFTSVGNYQSFDNGTFSVEVAEEDLGWENAAYVYPDVALRGGQSNTLVLYGTWAAATFLHMVDSTNGLASGQARVVLANLNANYPSLTVLGIAEVPKGELLLGGTASADVPAAALVVSLDTNLDAVEDMKFELPAPAADGVTELLFVNTEGGFNSIFNVRPNGRVDRFDPTPPE